MIRYLFTKDFWSDRPLSFHTPEAWPRAGETWKTVGNGVRYDHDEGGVDYKITLEPDTPNLNKRSITDVSQRLVEEYAHQTD